MSLDSLTYLLDFYWPYIAGAGVIGLLSGWFSYSVRK